MSEIVMYYVVNSELKMSTGKICSQIGHATVMVCLRLGNTPIVKKWLNNGQSKIVVKASEKVMNDLYERYRSSKDRWCVKVIDAGRTQIEEGSFTVIAFAPNEKDQYPDLKDLKLL